VTAVGYSCGGTEELDDAMDDESEELELLLEGVKLLENVLLLTDDSLLQDKELLEEA
jgi:hypothetical protein